LFTAASLLCCAYDRTALAPGHHALLSIRAIVPLEEHPLHPLDRGRVKLVVSLCVPVHQGCKLSEIMGA